MKQLTLGKNLSRSHRSLRARQRRKFDDLSWQHAGGLLTSPSTVKTPARAGIRPSACKPRRRWGSSKTALHVTPPAGYAAQRIKGEPRPMCAADREDASRRVCARHRQPFGRLALRRAPRPATSTCRSSRRSPASPSAASSTCLFISDGLVMDPGDHPSFLCRFEPTTLISALSAATTAYRPRRHRLDQLQRALSRRPHLRLDRPYQQRPRRLERGDQLEPARPR